MVKLNIIIKYTTALVVTIIIALSYLTAPKVLVTLSFMNISLNIPLPSNYVYVSVYVASAALVILIASIPEYGRWRINNYITGELPIFIRVIRDGLSTGLTITETINLTFKQGGVLARELGGRLRLSVVGPGELSAALMGLAHELNNRYLELASIVLESALRSGTKAAEVLDLAYRELDNVVVNELDKVNSLKPYIALAYTIIIIYVFLGSVILAILIPRLISVTSTIVSSLPTGLISFGSLSINVINSLFVYSIMIQSIFTGMIIGKVVYRNLGVGLMHSSIMTIIAVALNYVLNLYMPQIMHI
ncbi:hypothetical protein [Caldivirga maquilingensis]|uniref:hypothetical protein n=1 Tax=Caldivirga maquilingensis TaxID=76887 RepID=UPI00064F2B80|nr:hypothetical protein [Caldivirga maquilingensis]